jgi:endogenous inhibitor of DNA gyrase (YacG/DUF329 family)
VIRTETRHCPECGRPFTWTSRFANRRFCDPRCKAAWWRDAKNARRRELHRQRKATRTAAEPDAHNGNDGNDVALEALGDHVDPVRQPSPTAPGQWPATPVQTCPHCRNPVAVINLLVTPAAAYVNTPSPPVT